MDRKLIQERTGAVAEEMLQLATRMRELQNELSDLEAATRVLDRIEGKGDFSKVNAIAKALSDKPHHPRGTQKGWTPNHTYIGGLSRILSSPENQAALQRMAPLSEQLAAVLTGIPPQKKWTLPEAISHAMALMALEGKKQVTPKEVETVIFGMGVELGNQNVNSVMWRMADRGDLIKDPDRALYWINSVPKPEDQMGKGVLAGLEHPSKDDRDAGQEGE